jgi:hypothetical protein
MENFSSIVMAFAMVAAFLLAAAGLKLSLSRQSRTRGLMVAVAVVIVMNVMIWTV